MFFERLWNGFSTEYQAKLFGLECTKHAQQFEYIFFGIRLVSP